MTIFNSYVSLPEGNISIFQHALLSLSNDGFPAGSNRNMFNKKYTNIAGKLHWRPGISSISRPKKDAEKDEMMFS